MIGETAKADQDLAKRCASTVKLKSPDLRLVKCCWRVRSERRFCGAHMLSMPQAPEACSCEEVYARIMPDDNKVYRARCIYKIKRHHFVTISCLYHGRIFGHALILINIPMRSSPHKAWPPVGIISTPCQQIYDRAPARDSAMPAHCSTVQYILGGDAVVRVYAFH